jgi:hypothetical protein
VFLPQLSAVPFQTELYRRNPRSYVELINWGGKSGGATSAIIGGTWNLDTGLSAGASLICITAEYEQTGELLAGTGTNTIASKYIWNTPIILWTCLEVETAANPNDRHSQAGLTIGGAGAEVTDNPNGATVRLYARCDTNPYTYEIFTAHGNGAAGVFTPLTGIPTGGHFVSQRLMLVVLPGVSVQGYVNGVLGATVTGASIPDNATATAADQAAGVYVRCSPNANDETIARFAGFQVERIGRP